MIGQRVGPYDVLAKLGEGGMGEVYRARDTTLQRDVALKILPTAFAGDPERLARFEREARTLASLNHPHIGAVYGFEKSGATSALVMELVEGEDLSQRIARGALPLDEALPIARQIAEALEAAHEQGIIHRDLKPANIKVRADGTVKVLDFGLAKAIDPVPGTSGRGDLAQSPTITSPAQMTRMGVILGTAAYMSPEQARGKPVDKRADIWAFGVVLEEMLTGRPLFGGETVSDVLAAVLKTEPDPRRLPAQTPAAVRRVLRRCLARDPRQRLHDIADARIELEEAVAEPQDPTRTVAPMSARAGALVTTSLILVIAAAFAAGRWTARPRTPIERAGNVAFSVQPPAGGATLVYELAMSRDGRRLVFRSSDSPRLHLRDLGGLETRVIPGTDGGELPFVSPDGQWLGFFADGKLKKVALDGGDPIPIGDVGLGGPGATWGSDGTIYFTPTFTSGLFKVGAEGGTPIQLTTPDRTRGEAGHMWATPLPGGAALIFTIFGGSGMNGSKVALLDLPSGRYDVLFEGAAAQYLTSGHLVFYRRGAHYAVPFDPDSRTVTGAERTVLRNVRHPTPMGQQLQLAFSDDGQLAYVPGTAPTHARPARLAWISRDGAQSPLPFEGLWGWGLNLSPEGQRVALVQYGQGEDQVWIYDLLRGTQEQLTREGENLWPAWHPDGKHVSFTTLVRGNYDIWWSAIDGSKPAEPLIEGDHDESEALWAADGRALVFQVYSDDTGPDIMLQRLDAPHGERTPLVKTRLSDSSAALSRDGKWLAYASGDAVYVTSYPGMTARTLVGRGASSPRWSGATGELFFLQDGYLMAARHSERAGRFELDTPHRLFAAPQVGANVVRFDVAPDGKRFLFLVPIPGQASGDEIHVRLNGFDELQASAGQRD